MIDGIGGLWYPLAVTRLYRVTRARTLQASLALFVTLIIGQSAGDSNGIVPWQRPGPSRPPLARSV
jgi:predicted alpha-1,6-mannanase (GH76 family)